MSQETKNKIKKSSEDNKSAPKDLSGKRTDLVDKMDDLLEEIEDALKENALEKVASVAAEEEKCPCGFPLSQCEWNSPAMKALAAMLATSDHF